MNSEIVTAVALLRELRTERDAVVHAALVSNGIEPRTAARLIELLPVAYCRSILANLGIQCPDEFRRRLPDGALSQARPLSSEPLWNDILAFSRMEIAGGVSRNDLLAIAGRSSEFDAANQLMNKGALPKDIRFTALLFPWPEEGPE